MLKQSALKLACEVSGVAIPSVLAQQKAFIFLEINLFLLLNHLKVSR